jgi:predicted molibdopterin-dependent oxidoreductase YjgC
MVDVVSPRGRVRARARVTTIRPGVVFVPFHYGYWDADDADRNHRAANELTITEWDPASKQPIYKTAACRIEKIADANGTVAPAPTTTASRPVTAMPATTGGAAAQTTEQLGR